MDTFKFDDKRHLYTLNGQPLTGVTTILNVIAKPMLIGWAARMTAEFIEENAVKIAREDGSYLFEVSPAQLEEAKKAHTRKKEKAGEQGTSTHAQVEEYVKGCIATNNGLPVNSIMVEKPVLNSFIQWAIENKIKFIESEKRMYSKEWFVGGTCDLVFEKDGQRFVGDIKTMKTIWDRVPFFQMAAYLKMLRETDPNEYHGTCIINIPKETNKIEVSYSFDFEDDIKSFEAALILHRALNK